MSDILIVGKAPTSEDGKEYFLHCMDWWWDILFVIKRLFKDRYPVSEYFIRESDFTPPAPEMDEAESTKFAILLEASLKDGSARKCLEDIYRTNPNLIEYIDGDNELLTDTLNERMKQLEQFERFLKVCGGCNVRWYYPDY
jgi:hypothetical protein